MDVLSRAAEVRDFPFSWYLITALLCSSRVAENSWLPSPRATITPTHIQFAVLAEVSAVADSGAALEHAEHRVRRFLKWQNHDVFDANRMLPELVAAALRNRGAAVDEQASELGLRIAS